MDRRRKNKSIESRQENVLRLKEYRSKLVLFPIHENKKLRKGEATAEERKQVVQFKGKLMPLTKAQPALEFRKITDEEKKFSAFHTLRRVCVAARKYLWSVLFIVLPSIFAGSC